MYGLQHTVGLSMIVKDEETLISRALSSVMGYVHQILVVDTGSRDRTPTICTKSGAELHFFHWQDDFSLARNYALAFMRTDWVIQLDADEEIVDPKKWFGFIDSVRNNTKIGGVRVRIMNELDGGSRSSSHSYTRLFRRIETFRYEGTIHEQIAQSIMRSGYDIIDSELTILHSGYSIKNPTKELRNRNILEKELSERPDDSFMLYHKANTHFSEGDYPNAKECYRILIFDFSLSEEQRNMSGLRLAQIAIMEEDFSIAESLLQNEILNKELDGFRLYLLGSIDAVKGRYSSAIDNFNKSLKSSLVNKNETEYFVDRIKAVYKERK